jgi:hypothetical protein
VVLFGSRLLYAVAFLVLASALAAVLIYRYGAGALVRMRHQEWSDDRVRRRQLSREYQRGSVSSRRSKEARPAADATLPMVGPSPWW